jgi:hypothetical protein
MVDQPQSMETDDFDVLCGASFVCRILSSIQRLKRASRNHMATRWHERQVSCWWPPAASRSTHIFRPHCQDATPTDRHMTVMRHSPIEGFLKDIVRVTQSPPIQPCFSYIEFCLTSLVQRKFPRASRVGVPVFASYS